MAGDLVRNGWVQRIHCKDNRRKICLQLTLRGVALVEGLIPESQAYLVQEWSSVGATEKDTLEMLLRKLLDTLDGWKTRLACMISISNR